MNKEVEDALCMLLHCSLKDTEYETQREQFKIVCNHIEELQQRIDKAIEYINEYLFEGDNGCGCWWYGFEYYQDAKKELLEILGDKENRGE